MAFSSVVSVNHPLDLIPLDSLPVKRILSASIFFISLYQEVVKPGFVQAQIRIMRQTCTGFYFRAAPVLLTVLWPAPGLQNLLLASEHLMAPAQNKETLPASFC